MTNAPFSGIEVLSPGESLSKNGYRFQGLDRLIIDRLLRIGALTHRHDAHAAMANPATAPVVTSAATGGAIGSDQTIYVTYTLLDADGGESLPVASVVVNTPAGFLEPTGAPSAVVAHDSGGLLSGTYTYAVTVTDGVGGETTIGPSVVAVVDPGFASSKVTLSGLSAIVAAASGGAVGAGWRLWRSQGGGPWYLISSGTSDTLADGGVPGDCTIAPPNKSTTVGSNLLKVTIPAAGQPASAQQFRVYGSLDGSFTSPALLGTYPRADFGAEKDYTSLTPTTGSPPSSSTAFGGANRIMPDTDIVFGFKSPVADASLLPAGSQGDARVALNTKHLWMVLGVSAAVPADWTDMTFSLNASPRWRDPVDTAADLPGTSNTDGDVRVSIDDWTFHIWSTGAWHDIGEDAPAGAPSWRDSVATSADLPSGGNTDGDVRVTRNDGGIHVWFGSAWHSFAGGSGGLSYSSGGWDPALIYSTNVVVRGSDGSAYVSLADGNTGNDPTTSPTWWDTLVAHGTSGSTGLNRTDVTFASALLAAAAEGHYDEAVAKISKAIMVSTDYPARVRAYATDAYRTADSARPIGADPAGDHGLLLEMVLTAGHLSYALSPAASLHNLDVSPSSTIYFAVKNLDNVARTVHTTITTLPEET